MYTHTHPHVHVHVHLHVRVWFRVHGHQAMGNGGVGPTQS